MDDEVGETSSEQPYVEIMVEVHPRYLRDFSLLDIASSQANIARSPLNANNFEIKSSLIQMVQQNQSLIFIS